MDDALALDVASGLRGFGLSIQKRSLAQWAGTFGLLAAAAHEFDVTHGSVVAQMAGDGEVVHGTDRDFLAHDSVALLKIRFSLFTGSGRQWLRTPIFFVSNPRLRVRNQNSD